MANSPFKKENLSITIPVSVPNGGTGRNSLPANSVLVGAGVGDITPVAPGPSGEALVSDGTSWKSGKIAPPDTSITEAKLASDLSGTSSISALNVDWSTSSIFTKTLTSNTTLTFSNYQLNKVITLIIDGNYSLNFPNTVKTISGIYDGITTNYITLHCIKATAPEEVWAVVNNKYVSQYYYGYFAGGHSTSITTLTDRIVFYTGVTSVNNVSNLSVQREYLAGVSDSSTYGYFAGGYYGGNYATTDRIVFSIGATSVNTVSNLSQARAGVAGVSDSSTYGYFSGGYSGGYISIADRIVFSTGATSANTVSNLSQARADLVGVSDSSNYGYLAGGYIGSYVSTTDRIIFSTGVTSLNTVSNLSQATADPAGVSDSSTYGYVAGGETVSGYYITTTNRIVFSSGATSVNTVSNLSQARAGVAGVSDSSTYGYFSGGSSYSGVYVTTTDRIIFSTGVTSLNTVSNLSQARGNLAGVSDCSV